MCHMIRHCALINVFKLGGVSNFEMSVFSLKQNFEIGVKFI